VHLEGPFLSRLDGFRGAHNAVLMRDPDEALFARLQAAAGGRVRAITLAPELPGAADFVRTVAAQGVLVAVGHSAADGGALAAAVAAGARLATHVGNGAPAQLPRHPNPIWDQLACDGLCASLIADGHHLPDSVLKVALRAKRGDCVLVSDSVAIAGRAPGAYSTAVGGSVVLTENGRLHLASDPRLLAGSAISLDRAVAHVAFTPGLLPGPWRSALATAWAMASTRPAALAGLPQAAGLRVGAPADLVIFAASSSTQAKIEVREALKAGRTL
jgi:N-acetylglucosamine-6-phosphate deacetylase